MKLLAAKYSLVLGVSWTFLHFAANGYVFVEKKVLSALEAKQAQAEEIIASKFGYIKPVPTWDDADAMIVAERFALERGMNPALARAVIKHESAKNQFAISPVGAIGFMQIMPANAKRCHLKVEELFNKTKNIRCGLQILDEDISANGGDVTRGIWQYNGGPNAVKVILQCGHNLKCMGGYDESYKHARNILNTMARDITV